MSESAGMCQRVQHLVALALLAAVLLAASLIRAESAPAGGPHGPYSEVADQCATCHRVHAGQGRSIQRRPAPQSNLCLSCHDGSGATSDVNAEYTDTTVPANDSSSRSYYRHDALVATSHTAGRLNEFGGVINRHSECGDCHNAHAASPSDATETTTGWTASGRIAGVSGVSVVNHAAGTSPTYTFRDGIADTVDREYQLCLKCHSGFTDLPSNSGFPPSQYVLDKGVEFNPNNASYHPVEAPGKNSTAKMAANLAAPSPYKQWTFNTDSTVRCSSCHVSADRYSETPPPSAGSDLAPHTSRYRGILIRNYRDRVLKSASEDYSSADFALCYACHGEAPYSTETSTATNFPEHGEHLSDIKGEGSGGTDIDTAGAGAGNALCAECHFRLHSTSYEYGSQAIDGRRLVNFAPNVRPNGGTLTWTGSSCTLTCHGKEHDDESY